MNVEDGGEGPPDVPPVLILRIERKNTKCYDRIAYRGPLGSITRYLAKTKAYRYLTVGSPLTVQHLLQNTMTRPESRRPGFFFPFKSSPLSQNVCVFVHKNNRAIY